jgi:Leucine-rich repeat (LRR) protein
MTALNIKLLNIFLIITEFVCANFNLENECKTVRTTIIIDLECELYNFNRSSFPNLTSQYEYRNFILINKNYSKIPDYALSGLKVTDMIDLSNNQLEIIENKAFETNETHKSIIRQLILKSNRITKLNGKAFDVFANLVDLDLSFNLIVVISNLAFRSLGCLNKLDLSGNKIAIMESKSFQGLGNLLNLKLKSNRIEFLDENLFADLKNLDDLDLSENYLTLIEPGCFNGLKLLKYLFLDDNPIYIFKNRSFSGLESMRDLTLNSLGLTFIESFAFVGLSNLNQLNILMNKNVSYLNSQVFYGLNYLTFLALDINEIQSIHPDAFLGLNELETLTLSKNKLTEIDPECFRGMGSLYELDLSTNRIKSLRVRNFKYLKKLKILRLGQNALESFESDLLFDSNTHGLYELYLNENKLQILRKNFFIFRDLTDLSLKSNQISVIERETFAHLYQIKLLDLSDNCILFIDSAIFKRLPYDNKVYKLPKLKIDLSKNVIHTIENNTFIHLSESLAELDLRSNQIVEIRQEAFLKNILLKTLKLESNLLNPAAKNSIIFSSIGSLETLDVSQNKIQALNNKSFISTFLLELKSLNLMSNRLKHLNGSLKPLEKLRILLLGNNLLESIEYKDFNSLLDLNQLDLSNNPALFVVANDVKFINLEIEILNLRNTSRNLVSLSRLTTLGGLVELDLSFNDLSQLNLNNPSPYLNCLWLKNVHSIDFRTFENKRALSALDLSNNQGLNFSLLDFYLKSLTISELFMRNVSLNSMRMLKFASYRGLRELDLSHNEISEMKSDQFASNKKLHTLKMSYNNISILERGSLSSIKSLRIFYLRSNNLKYFAESLPSLTDIDLGQNKLSHVSVIIDGIKTINLSENLLAENEINFIVKSVDQSSTAKIDLSFNKIKYLHKDLSFIIKKATLLHLRGNKMEKIENYTFLKLNNLLDLDLSQNVLGKSLEMYSLKGLYYLEKLNLSDNRIESVPQELFEDLSYLYTFDLSKNHIKYIYDFSFKNMKNVKTFYIHSNPDLQIESTNVFYGLDSISDFYLSNQVLIEKKSNLINFKESFKPERAQKNSNTGLINYFTSLDFNSMMDIKETFHYYTQLDCLNILEFSRSNLHLNLKSDSDAIKFLNECANILKISSLIKKKDK